MTAQPAAAPADAATRLHLLGNLIEFHATAAATGGAYSLVEVTTAPGAGTPPHVHSSDEEAFFVLEGTYSFFHDGRTLSGRPGTWLLIRRGEAHAFRNETDRPARMLIINSPGGLHERFFREAGDELPPAGGLPGPAEPDMARLTAAAARADISFLAQERAPA